MNKEKNALFITSDLKEDWWEIPKKDYDLVSYEARKELVQEFNELTGKRIRFIPFDLFVSFLESYNNQESLYNYLFQNIAEIESVVSDQVLEFVRKNKKLIISDDDIIWDSDITKGYVPYAPKIDVTDEEIVSVEINSFDEDDNGGFSVELIVSVNVYGYFDVSSGLEVETYNNVEGDFTKEDILSHVTINFSSKQVTDLKNSMINSDLDYFDRIVKEAEVREIDLIDSEIESILYNDKK